MLETPLAQDVMKPQNLVITKSSELRQVVLEALGATYKFDFVKDFERGLEDFRTNRYEFTFVDIEILRPGKETTRIQIGELLESFRNVFPAAKVIAISSIERIRDCVWAVRNGADDYLTYPIDPEELELLVDKIDDQEIRKAALEHFKDEFWNPESDDIVKTKNIKLREVYKKVQSVAKTITTVLLTGETGVGKGVVARLIHDHSKRAKAQFISIHCGAIAESLVESELFGHEKGAFTGAIKRKLGKFEIASGGTIFLDEIGTISPAVQIKLLQVLQDSIYQRVGGESELKTDVRIIAATNEDLKILTQKKIFRSDLFYRLNVFPIEIPPLRNRFEDIEHLVNLFIGKLNITHQKEIKGIDVSALRILETYEWPGNIRELHNLVERAYVLESTTKLTMESFPSELTRSASSGAVVPLDTDVPLEEARRKILDSFERQYLKELLAKKKGRINQTAEAAGLGVRQIHKLMAKYGLTKSEFKNTEIEERVP